MRSPIPRRAVSRGTGRTLTLALGVGAFLTIVAMSWIGYNAPNSLPGRSYYTIKANFEFADNITSHAQVRVGGRLIGQVLNPRVENGIGVVDLQLDPVIRPLLSDTKLEVRPRSPVGVRFIDVTPGTKGRPLGEGEVIGASQNSAPVELDEVLGALDAKTRARTQTLMSQLGAGTMGRADDIGQTLDEGPEFLDDARGLSNAINNRRGATERFMAGAADALGAIAPVKDPLGQGLRPQAQALDAVADADDELRETFREAPRALTAVRTELPSVSVLLRAVRRFSDRSRPVLDEVPATLRQTTALLREAPAPVRRLRTTVGLAGQAAGPAVALLDRLKLELPDVDVTLTSPLDALKYLAPRQCDFESIFQNWADMDSYGSASTNRLRFEIVGPDVEALQGQQKPLAGLPTATFLQNPYPEPCTAGNEYGEAHTNHADGVPGGTRPQDPETIIAAGGTP